VLEQLAGFFMSGFANPSAWGIGLAVIFGAVWLTCYWPARFKEHRWPWTVLIFIAVLVGSAILTWAAVAFIQIPLQGLIGQALNHFWSQAVLMQWLLLAGIPQILLSGLVQEGAKLVPVVAYWWRKGRNIDPKVGLVVGAVAGVGLGVFEAQWAHNSIFASGWTWGVVQTGGLVMLAGFWERFFAVAFHTATSALAGYGLARGWGWQFYLIAAFVHAFMNYSAVFSKLGLLTTVQLEMFVALWAVIVTAGALWLRWRRGEVLIESELAGSED